MCVSKTHSLDSERKGLCIPTFARSPLFSPFPLVPCLPKEAYQGRSLYNALHFPQRKKDPSPFSFWPYAADSVISSMVMANTRSEVMGGHTSEISTLGEVQVSFLPIRTGRLKCENSFRFCPSSVEMLGLGYSRTWMLSSFLAS